MAGMARNGLKKAENCGYGLEWLEMAGNGLYKAEVNLMC